MFGISGIKYENKNGVFHFNIKDKTLSYMSMNQQIKEDAIINYLDKFFRIIDSWQEEYSSSNIIGGDSWQLHIEYIDGRVKKYSGYSSLPNNFEAFDILNQDLFKGEL